jgi:ATPase subunit of ABC transporter with duplicated ATPase domains
MLLNMDKLKSEEKKQQDEAAKLQQQLRATQDSVQKLKNSSGTSSVTGSMQSGLNDVNSSANQAKATQTTVKNIGAIAKDLNPLKK